MSRRAWMTGVLLLLALLPVAGRAAEAGFAGAAACAACHKAQWESQSQSGHARSMSQPGAHRLAAKFPARTGDWAFGGGLQAVTFVSRLDASTYLEHGLSYYAATGRMAPTPGHAGKSGAGERYRTFAADAAILRCFLCHSTGTPEVTAVGEIVPREPGVRCEVCHGPGAAHAADPGKEGAIVNPKRYTAAELNTMCGSCHRKPAVAGDDTDYANPWNARHQPLYFARSACFQKSKGELSCLTCHPPHGGATRTVCASCHESVRHPARVATQGRTCESCHMPVVRPMAELGFANHWIGVYRAGETLVPRR